MTDKFPPEKRRAIMQAIGGKNTKPEMTVRRIITAFGFRYRLHDTNLPGKPDLVFRKQSKIIFVHGCYWHAHSCKHGRIVPKTNTAFWLEKRKKNKDRDKRVLTALRKAGWRVQVVWECQTKSQKALQGLSQTLFNFLQK